MSKIGLIATKEMRYGARSLTAGDDFEASPRDARILKAIGKAAPKPEADPAGQREAERLDRLRADYEKATGDVADGRWGADRIEREIGNAAKASAYKRRDMRAEG